MSVLHDIPSFLKFGLYLVRVFYAGQPKVCWKCSSPDHIRRECPSNYCFNCDESGQKAHDCTKLISCSLRKSEEHLAVDCEGNWGRHTLAQRTPSRNEDQDPAPEDDEDMGDGQEDAEEAETTEGSDEPQGSQESAEDEIKPFSSDTDDTVHEVGESVDEFTSPETGDEPPPKLWKRGAVVGSNVKKKSRSEENPPQPLPSRLSH